MWVREWLCQIGWLGESLFEVHPKQSQPQNAAKQDSRQGEEPGKGPPVGTNLVDSMAVPTRASQKATGPASTFQEQQDNPTALSLPVR